MSYQDFDIDKARQLREKAKDGFARQSRISLLGTAWGSLLIMALIVFAAMKWANASSAESAMFYAGLIFFGILMNTGVWACYGLDARLLFMLKEIKQLRLDFLSSTDAPLERATGGAESITAWNTNFLKIRTLTALVLVLFLIAGGLALLYDKMTYTFHDGWFGQEVTEVHVTPEGTFRVVSRIGITECPSNIATLPFRLPHPGATLESVTIAGRPIPFRPLPDKADCYVILPGMPENALVDATLEVIWSPSTSDVTVEGEKRRFRLQLQPMIGVTAYTANAVIDDGAPYRFSGPMVSVRSYNMFWTKRPREDYRWDLMGSCDIWIEAVPNT